MMRPRAIERKASPVCKPGRAPRSDRCHSVPVQRTGVRRVLDRITAGEDTEVGSAISALKNVAPAVDIGAVQTNDIGSQEWNIGVDDLSTACAGVDVELAVMMFTGG